MRFCCFVDGVVNHASQLQLASRAFATEMINYNSIEDFAIKIMSPTAGVTTMRFRRGVNLECVEDPIDHPGNFLCRYQKSIREQIREFMNSD